jgi:hypothetical protein
MLDANLVRGGVRAASGLSSVGSGVAVELNIVWGDAVLVSAELLPEQPFVIGDDASLAGKVDFVLPAVPGAPPLGANGFKLLSWRAGAPVLHVPLGARIEGPNAAPAAAQAEWVEPELELHDGVGQTLELNGLWFTACVGPAQPRWARSFADQSSRSVGGYLALSALSALGVLAGLAFFVPPLGLNDSESLSADRLYLLQQYLDANAERQREPEPKAGEASAGGKPGEAAAQAEGAAGDVAAPKRSAKLAVKGDAQEPPRPSARAEAENFGMIGLLAASAANLSLDAPWQRDPSLGNESIDARGQMWGEELGDAFGSGGLGLLGLAQGGGGVGTGIGLGPIGTVGSAGSCTGPVCPGFGFGSSHGRLDGSHAPNGPQVRMSQPVLSGRLPPQVIQRIVRQNFGRFRQCYERGLARNPTLEGRVQVRFLIDRSGVVSNVQNGGTSLPDSAVTSCVVQAFYGLSFPKPESGSVQVSYPIMFSPG